MVLHCWNLKDDGSSSTQEEVEGSMELSITGNEVLEVKLESFPHPFYSSNHGGDDEEWSYMFSCSRLSPFLMPLVCIYGGLGKKTDDSWDWWRGCMCTVCKPSIEGLYDVWLAILTPLLTIFNKVFYLLLSLVGAACFLSTFWARVHHRSIVNH